MTTTTLLLKEWQSASGYWPQIVSVWIVFILWRIQQHHYQDNTIVDSMKVDPNIPTHKLHHSHKLTRQNGCDDISTSDTIDSDDDDENDGNTNADAMRAKRELEKLVPSSTEAECTRFVTASRNDTKRAKAKLDSYLQWHQDHTALVHLLDPNILLSNCKDDDWTIASQVAKMVACKQKSSTPLTTASATVARIARMYCNNVSGDSICDREGHRILHIMPGRMDSTLVQPCTYALALALYIDRKLDRSSEETITVLIDVRGRKGWQNRHPCRQLSFIQSVTKLLLAMFPERLHRCLVFPVPTSGMWIWNLCKGWIDPSTVSKIHLLEGEARIFSPPPFGQMEVFMTPEIAQWLEDQRNDDLED